MSKKSYKRHQNRLYREIKRRIIAEQMWLKPMPIQVCERKIDTLKISNVVPRYMDYDDRPEFIKTEMANKFASKLLADGYIQFKTDCDIFNEFDAIRIDAKLDVVKPLDVGDVQHENRL
jgi:hypothetical protein